jgi:CheY-like chemotaxis protein
MAFLRRLDNSETDRQVVLVVEDEVLVRMLVADALREAGFIVLEVSNADEAARALAAEPEVRAVFTDIRMPGRLDGKSLAQLVRTDYPSTKVLLTSGHTRETETVRHDGFFEKPYSIDKVIAHIQKLLK